eukprot:c8762_g1_i1.p1 GENE.c8762_g1_i1~~c8762_g1_i1.p1  ORF type:complete len:773 (-),score=179.04 c8762_g1_i1:48-2366(-)
MSNQDSGSVTYGWKEVVADLEAGKYIGNYGANNGVYQAVAEAQAGKDLNAVHCLRHDDEHMVPELTELLSQPQIQANWDQVISFNPAGLTAKRPTIAATYARMDIPELRLVPDGQIVHEDNSISVIKAGIEPTWNIPAIARRLDIPETRLRQTLQRYTQIPAMADENIKVFLPQIGGATVYFFGDPRKLADPTTEVAVRCHDECNGSDVFCTDICTCRPYLLFAIQGAVECAQRGGVGMIAYFRKEGRGLGEVTKFRVYNARKNQPGGDRPEMYFKQTENIAGIRDARLQELMPDVLLWLGVRRIKWLLSMSSDKYNAIIGAGIEVLQRVSLPNEYVPRDALVEITAKVSAGYHVEAMDNESLQASLSRLQSIRDRCGKVFEVIKQGRSKFFTLDESKLPEVADRVVACLFRQYKGPKDVPYHSRCRHFELPDGTDLIQKLHTSWNVSDHERIRRLIDLTVVSVLTDAGAGTQWSYLNQARQQFSKSEGLAIASYEMFVDGFFSSDRALPHRVNSLGLEDISLDALYKRYQISDSNSILGLEGRLRKLHNLAQGLNSHPEFFGAECPRPGNMLDYLLPLVTEHKDGTRHLSVNTLWRVVIEGMSKCWPAKAILGLSNGDVWQCTAIKEPGHVGSDLVPCHKLPQWLMYSLIEIFERFVGIHFDDVHLLTGLAEYRNGGLFIDTGVLQISRQDVAEMVHDIGSEVVVEWRAATIILIDRVAELVRAKLQVSSEEFPLAKVLQAGTWQAGREVAKEKRSDGSAPLKTHLDGTVF